MSLRLKKGDMVKIITGESKGQTGKILNVFTGKGRVTIEGKNLVKRHTKPNQKNQQGGIMEKEASMHISNLMLLDGKAGKPTRFGIKMLDQGRKARYLKKSKELAD